ncbi:threonine/serine exporter family protein [Ruminiclostridium josui]|uniref:threonine/serine exporter family protein n=1 Tax=Ruminiclostridium josui TaxID=1499 RepID=UPI000464A9CB|nr:threonine/serine exporter family protein [Ruminiclostridium josui]
MFQQTVLAFFGSIFPVILFNIDRRKILWAGFCGAIGWIIYSLVYENTNNPILSSFFGGLTVGIYSESMARILKTPTFEFLIPGIFPLVPGMMAYRTLLFIVENNMSSAFSSGTQTLAVGGAIGFGIMLATTIFKFISRIQKNRKKLLTKL